MVGKLTGRRGKKMLIYLINFLSIPFYLLVDKNKKRVLFIVCLQMFLILCCRADTLGADLGNYKLYYTVWSKYSFEEMVRTTRFFIGQQIFWGLESGYVWLCWIFAKVGMPFHAFLIIHALICMVGLYKFINEYAENKALVLMMIISFGVYQTFFYILRQSLAFIILLSSVKFIKERKFWKFFFIVCLSVLFHRTALAFLFIYFLYNIKISKKTFFYMYGICFLFFLSIGMLYDKTFGVVLQLIGKEAYQLGSFTMNNMIILMFLISVFILVMADIKKTFENENYRVCFWAMFFAMLLEILSLYAPVYSRPAISMFFPFAMLLFADVINTQRIRTNKIICTVSSSIFLFLFYVYQLNSSYIVPYVSIWATGIP